MKQPAFENGSRGRLIAQLCIAVGVAALFALLSVNAGPLSQLDQIGGWDARRLYIAAVSAGLLLVFAVLALQKYRWAEYALLAGGLFAGALLRLYLLDSLSPYYAENLAPVIRSLSQETPAWQLSGYTPLTAALLRLLSGTAVYPRYCVKLLSILCDLCVAISLGALGNRREKDGMRAALLYLLCPVFFLYGAYAGTMDSAYVLLVLLGALAMKKGRNALGWSLFGAACALDPMSLAALPALLLYGARRSRDRTPLCAPGVCALLSVPAFAMGMPLRAALPSFFPGMRNMQAMHVRSSSLYNFIAPVYVKDLPLYHILRHAPQVTGEELINAAYTAESLWALRAAFSVVFVVAAAAMTVFLWKRREKLAPCRDAAAAFGTLAFMMSVPGVDAAGFILADIAMIRYALRVRGGYRAALLSLGASAMSAVAFVTGAELVPLWIGMAMQCAALTLLGCEIVRTLNRQGALGEASAPHRI